ncbi:hypothetical protein VTO42DRAFT_5740 [Malbranchea cinnamomea]
MTLKRKASFTTTTSPRAPSSYNGAVAPVPFFTGDVITIDETPRHLHSRTRKRFKNDRPDDQTVYERTMQWLYSAQKQMKHCEPSLSSTPIEADPDEPPYTIPTTPDPTQLTLRKFFQPVVTSSHVQPGTGANCHSTVTSVVGVNSTFQSASSGSTATSMEVDRDMCMEVDIPSDTSPSPSTSQKKWVGGIGWM